MIIPIIVSAVIYHESITILRLIGIAVTVVALYFTTERSTNNPNYKKWALYTAMAFIANCCISLTQKVFTKSFALSRTSSFVAVHFAFTAIIALAAYLWLSLKGKKCSYDLSISVLAATAAIGVVLGGFHLVYTYALSVIDATILIPMYNGGYTILVTIGSTCLMKEKLSRRQLVSIILGVIAIVLMSL